MRRVAFLVLSLIISVSIWSCRPEGEATNETPISSAGSETVASDPRQSGVSVTISAIPSDLPPPSDPYGSMEMESRFWYDPISGQVCHREGEMAPIVCRSMDLACVLGSDHGHEFYTCRKEDGSSTIELVFHFDSITEKFLVCMACSTIPPPVPTPSPSPSPTPYPPMNPNVWYNPATREVCLRNPETQTVTCMVTTLTCSLEQEHGHNFYRCVRDDGNIRLEIIYHEDPVTGKYLFFGSSSLPPSASTFTPLVSATFCPSPENTFNSGGTDCIIFGPPPAAGGAIPFEWGRSYTNCVATPMPPDMLELRCTNLGSLMPRVVVEGSRISLRIENVMITDRGTTQNFIYVRQ